MNVTTKYITLIVTLGVYSFLWLPQIALNLNRINNCIKINKCLISAYKIFSFVYLVAFITIVGQFLYFYINPSNSIASGFLYFLSLIFINNFIGFFWVIVEFTLIFYITKSLQDLYVRNGISEKPKILSVFLLNFTFLLSLPFLQKKLDYLISSIEKQNEK